METMQLCGCQTLLQVNINPPECVLDFNEVYGFFINNMTI